jgi:hypothetical protein
MPTQKDETIAWVIWHIARIEDLTMNFLVARKEQIFSEEWKDKLGITLVDTGNAWSDPEIMEMSHDVNLEELLNYWDEVGRQTQKVISDLKAEDMKRKVNPEDLQKILQAGGITTQKDSIWLLDFWGKKDVAGLLLMPPTRHVMLHLNDCCKWKEMIRKRKQFFLQ